MHGMYGAITPGHSTTQNVARESRPQTQSNRDSTWTLTVASTEVRDEKAFHPVRRHRRGLLHTKRQKRPRYGESSSFQAKPRVGSRPIFSGTESVSQNTRIAWGSLRIMRDPRGSNSRGKATPGATEHSDPVLT